MYTKHGASDHTTIEKVKEILEREVKWPKSRAKTFEKTNRSTHVVFGGKFSFQRKPSVNQM